MSPIFIVLLIVAVASANPRKCGKNAVWSECASACPRTCENLNKPPRVCIAVCVNRCVCRKGYVLHEKLNICLKPKQCKKIIIDKINPKL